MLKRNGRPVKARPAANHAHARRGSHCWVSHRTDRAVGTDGVCKRFLDEIGSLRLSDPRPVMMRYGYSTRPAAYLWLSKTTKLVVMRRENIVWEQDLTILVLCWSFGMSDRSRLLSLCRLGNVGVS
jgi:hypothetical protein